MCTAVVGGLIHFEAMRINTANDQKLARISNAPPASLALRERKKPARIRAFADKLVVSGTFQNTRRTAAGTCSITPVIPGDISAS